MTLNYQYWTIRFEPASYVNVGNDDIIMDDSDFDACFDAFTEGGKNIVVPLAPGSWRRLLETIHRRFIHVKAAGGIVENAAGNRLIMVRNELYDLPKGKVEPGETLAQAAIRETAEETGLSDVVLGPLALKTYHIYNLYGGWHFKQTSWFRMRMVSEQSLQPQVEENITNLLWISPSEWQMRLRNSYSTMRIISDKIPV